MEARSGPETAPVANDGLAALFVAERGPMLQLATLMVGSVALAEEVVQDAFAAVGERWGGLERPGGYLRTCVVNGCAQILRRRPIENRVEQMRLVEADAELPARLFEVRNALDKLSEAQRMVVVLRYFVDIDDHEIAELLDMRPSTIRSHARRAFATMRKELS